MASQTVYVEVLIEAVETWRPVRATEEGSGLYRLPDTAPADERWAFTPGTLVRCEQRQLADGAALVVVASA